MGTGPSFLGLPVVVAGAGVLVAVGARRHAQARRAALSAEEEARLPVRRRRAPRRAPAAALCCKHARTQHSNIFSITYYSIVFVDDVRFREVLLVVCARAHTHTDLGAGGCQG